MNDNTENICPITLEPLSKIEHTYANDQGRQYDAMALYNYMLHAQTLRDPLTRQHMSIQNMHEQNHKQS